MAPKKPGDFGTTKRLQKEYEKGVRKIVSRSIPVKLPEQTLEQWLAAIAERSQQADIQEASDFLARRMVYMTNVINARTWREAAARSQHSRKLYALLQKEMQGVTGSRVSALVRENAALISSIALDSAMTLTGEVTRAQQAGSRPGTIAKMMRQRFPELLKSRVNLISRTETAKASTALTHARCEELGIDFYVWLTSQDGDRVRESHRNMHDVLVPWHQAPAPEALIGERSTLGSYHAGECPNCRCTQYAVLSIDDLTWPRRVYWNGQVSMMDKQRFLSTVAPRAA
jgi:SPP1 gp7 family putative phage head morphogenesis protein